jgi:hypothetical protein
MPVHDTARPAEPGAAPAPATGAGTETGEGTETATATATEATTAARTATETETETGTGTAPVTGESEREGPGAAPPERRSRAGRLLGRVPPRWRMPLATYAACQLIFLIWWAAFYPGLTSFDSIVYTLHVTTGPWVDNHSVVYDSMVWLSLHLTGNFAALTFGQTVAASATFAYAVVAFRRLGVPGRWTAIAAVVLAALPPTGTLIVFVWKDAAFTLCVLLLVVTLAHLVSLRGRAGWQRERRVSWLIAAIGFELLGMCLFRPNGFIVVGFCAIGLVALLAKVRAKVAGVAVAAICLFFVLNYVVYPAAGIQKAPTSLTYGTAYADIAVAYADSPASFTPADTALMARVAPLTAWRTSADCYSSDTTTSAVPGFTGRAERLNSQLTALWVRILKRTPNFILGARICRASIAWSIFNGPPKRLGVVEVPLDAPPANLFGLARLSDVRHNPYRATFYPHPLSAKLHKAAEFLYSASETPQLQWLLWRGAFWCYVSYLALFAYARARRNWAVLSIGAVVLAQQLTILLDNPAQLYRYMVSPIFIGVLLVPLFFARHRRPVPPSAL